MVTALGAIFLALINVPMLPANRRRIIITIFTGLLVTLGLFWYNARFGESLDETASCVIFSYLDKCKGKEVYVEAPRLPRLNIWPSRERIEGEQTNNSRSQRAPFEPTTDWRKLPRWVRTTQYVTWLDEAHPQSVRMGSWWRGYVKTWRKGYPQRALPSRTDDVQYVDQDRNRDLADAAKAEDPSYLWIVKHPGACQPLRDYLEVNPNGRLSYLVNRALLARTEYRHRGEVTTSVRHGPYLATDRSQSSDVSEWNACNAAIERIRSRYRRTCLNSKPNIYAEFMSYDSYHSPSECRCRPMFLYSGRYYCEVAAENICHYRTISYENYEKCGIL